MKLILLLVALTIPSCIGAGSANYDALIEISPYQVGSVESETLETVCCEISADISVRNGKDIDKVDFGAEKLPDGSYRIWLRENGVGASEPASVAAGAIGVVAEAAAGVATEAIRATSPLGSVLNE